VTLAVPWAPGLHDGRLVSLPEAVPLPVAFAVTLLPDIVHSADAVPLVVA